MSRPGRKIRLLATLFSLAAIPLAAPPVAGAQAGCPACDEYRLVLPDDRKSGYEPPLSSAPSGSATGAPQVSVSTVGLGEGADQKASISKAASLGDSINALAPYERARQASASREGESTGVASLLFGLGAIALAGGAYALFGPRRRSA